MEEKQMIDSVLQQFLNEKKDYIIKKYKPVKFILFGSRVGASQMVSVILI